MRLPADVRIRVFIALLFSLLLAATVRGESAPPLLHTPTISSSQIVFVYGDELWSVPRQGGAAHLLTSGPGVKSSPSLSPDGKWLAFSLDVERNVDVYVMPAEGGEAKRLTHHPAIDDVVGWTPDSKRILFRSSRNSYSRFNRLFTVSPDGGLPMEVPLPMAETGSYSRDGSHLAYVPFTNARRLNAAAWRRYRGGNSARVWIANLADSSITKLPRTDSQDSNPMWVGDKVYFISDRHDGVAGLYVYDTKSHDLREAVHPERDIKSAAATTDAIVYEQFGSLHLLDVTSGRENALRVEIRGDVPAARPHFIKGAEQIASADLSPSGARAVFESHGEILTAPREKGDIRNLTNTTGVAERYPSWSPDGRQIAYFSDESGEYALHVRSADGTGEVKKYQVPGAPSYFYDPVWSPDHKKIAFTDKRLNLWYVDLASGDAHKVDTDTYDHPERSLDPSWSPDSRWIVYSKRLLSFMHTICVYSLDSGKTQQVTDGLSDARHPRFDANGKFLYFLASTDSGPTSGWLDLSSFARPVTSSAYVMVLSKEEPSPLAPQSDEEKSEESPKPEQAAVKASANADAKPEVQDAKAAASKPKNVVVKIDFDNLGQRILALPLPAANYVGLSAAQENTIFVQEGPLVDMDSGPPSTTIYRFSLKDRKPEKLWDGISHFTVSFDGKRVLYSKAAGAPGSAQHWFIDDASAKPSHGGESGEAKELKLAGMEIYVDPRAEWEQMYNEVGRVERDFFYDPDLHGYDMKAALAEYKPYLASLSTRQDLSYLWEEMLGNITVGHLYIRGPMNTTPPGVRTGLLGADYTIENGRYRFQHIYRGENWNPHLHAPLTEPGVIVNEGDYLLEVNGRELKGSDEVFALFQGTAGKTISLKVGPDPSGKNARTVSVVPIDDERSLRNRDWIDHNRRRVDELSGGKLAYVYLPDTASNGYTYFNRYYYAQVGRQGAVIDERFNGGGDAADYIIDGMRRQLMSYWMTREGHDFTTPVSAIFGPKVMIINEHAGSGGDALPWYFREAKLGPLVGTRTWGGLVGIYDYPELIDGAEVTAPRVAFYSPNQKWEVENHGVDPDIEIDFDPQAWRQGRDPQLEKAIAVALDELKAQPLKSVSHPAYPRYNNLRTSGPATPASGSKPGNK